MERRSERRSLALDDLRITIGGHGLRCAMRNLSPSGCMVECQDIVAEVGTPVEVVLLPGQVAAGRTGRRVRAAARGLRTSITDDVFNK